MRIIKEKTLYKHFKGNIYYVECVGTNTETGLQEVVYHKKGDTKLWIRPLDMFLSEVDHEKYPQIKQKYRFEELCRE